MDLRIVKPFENYNHYMFHFKSPFISHGERIVSSLEKPTIRFKETILVYSENRNHVSKLLAKDAVVLNVKSRYAQQQLQSFGRLS